MDARHACPVVQSKIYVDHAHYVRNATLKYTAIDVDALRVATRIRSRRTGHRGQEQPWRIACRSGDVGAPGIMRPPLQGVRCCQNRAILLMRGPRYRPCISITTMDWCRHHYRAFGRSYEDLEGRRGWSIPRLKSSLGDVSCATEEALGHGAEMSVHMCRLSASMSTVRCMSPLPLQSNVVLPLETCTIYEPGSAAATVNGCADARMSP